MYGLAIGVVLRLRDGARGREGGDVEGGGALGGGRGRGSIRTASWMAGKILR